VNGRTQTLVQSVKWSHNSQNTIGTSIAVLLWHGIVDVTMNDHLHIDYSDKKEKSYEINE
jgi:hypothetical protein